MRLSFDQGAQVTSLVGYSLIYNTLDNNKNPTAGIRAEFKQDLAGLGGDVNFFRTTGDFRYYHEVDTGLSSALLRLQAGNIHGWGGSQLRFNDQFQGGPNLLRGFRQNGIGPRDLTRYTTQDAIGGTNFWAASVELQIPLYFLPKDVGIRAAIFADAGSVWDYQGPDLSCTGETMICRRQQARFAPRSVRAWSGIRRSGRCASTMRFRSPRRATTSFRNSASAAAPRSDPRAELDRTFTAVSAG